MPLFGKKKIVEKESTCCRGGNADSLTGAERAKSEGAGIKILGGGCAKCNALEAATKEALNTLGMDDAVEHVTDFSQIAAYGVMTTPALVIDGKVVSLGKALKPAEIVKLLEKVRGLQRETRVQRPLRGV